MMEADKVVVEILKDVEEVTMGFSPILVEDVDAVNNVNVVDDINTVDMAIPQHHAMLMDESFQQIIGTAQMNRENSANRKE